MAKQTKTPSTTRDNRSTALLFYPKGTGTVGGYYTDVNGDQYRVSGRVEGKSVSFSIFDNSGAVELGECTITAYAKPPRNPKAPVANGTLTFQGQRANVVAIRVPYNDGTTGHSVFIDNMPERGDAPF